MNFFYPIKLPYQKMHVLFYLIFGKYYNFSNLYGNPYRNVIIWLIWGAGENKRDYIYIDEIIDAIEAIYMYSGKYRMFNIGTGSSYSIQEIIKLIECIVDKKAQVIYKEKRQCDLLESNMDVSLIWNECGWRSKLSLKDGIELYINGLFHSVQK